MTIKIGFGYKARRGKDTACRAIVERLGKLQNIKQYAFADELREEVSAAVFDRWVQDFPNRDFEPGLAMQNLCEWAGVSYDTTLKPEPGYPNTKQRPLYQWWGQWRRSQDEGYWRKRVAARIECEAPAFALISDMRMFDEFEFCDYRIRMDRPGFEIADGSHHISERQLDEIPASRWDAVIKATTEDEVRSLAVHEFWMIWQRHRDATRAAVPIEALA